MSPVSKEADDAWLLEGKGDFLELCLSILSERDEISTL